VELHGVPIVSRGVISRRNGVNTTMSALLVELPAPAAALPAPAGGGGAAVAAQQARETGVAYRLVACCSVGRS